MIRVILNVSGNVQRVNYRSKVINNDPKTEESTMFFIDALSRALPQKLLGDAISTQFILKYYDVSKDIINPPISVYGGIYTIQVDVAVENIEAYDQKYSSVFWRQLRLVSRNLKNR